MDEVKHRAGIVALVGRPNVGKSTLMNYLIGDKVSITTPVAQTTRNQIRGIHTMPHAQIVYLDTPGVHHARTALNRYMVDVAMRSLEGVDVVLYLADINRPDPAVMEPDQPAPAGKHPGYKEDEYILECLRKTSVPTFLVVNKIDEISKKDKLLPFITSYSEQNDFDAVIPISALNGENTDTLVEEICKRLPEGPPLFPVEYATDHAERFLVAEIVREKVILHTRQALPHSTAVLVESFDESERVDFDEYDEDFDANRDGGLVRINATIVVERNSQKGIIIGKRGSMLKDIGSAARVDIENLLGCRVWLKLWVKVEKNWSHHNRTLRRMGYNE
jgi:GTP-binding protein Era